MEKKHPRILNIPENLENITDDQLKDLIILFTAINSISYSYSWKAGKYGRLKKVNGIEYRVNAKLYDRIVKLKSTLSNS
jgi:hypothetical protein